MSLAARKAGALGIGSSLTLSGHPGKDMDNRPTTAPAPTLHLPWKYIEQKANEQTQIVLKRNLSKERTLIRYRGVDGQENSEMVRSLINAAQSAGHNEKYCNSALPRLDEFEPGQCSPPPLPASAYGHNPSLRRLFEKDRKFLCELATARKRLQYRTADHFDPPYENEQLSEHEKPQSHKNLEKCPTIESTKKATDVLKRYIKDHLTVPVIFTSIPSQNGSTQSALNPYSTAELVTETKPNSYPIESKKTNQSIHTRFNGHNSTSHRKQDRRNSPDELPAVVSPEDIIQTNLPIQPAQRRSFRNNQRKPTVNNQSPVDDKQSILTISGIKNERHAEIHRLSSEDELDDTAPPDKLANPKPPMSTAVQSASSQQSTNCSNNNSTNNNTNTNTSRLIRQRPVYKSSINGARPVVQRRSKEDMEPKYADPISGANSHFQSRLAEISSLETETVRWERMKKLKKKSKSDD